MIRLCKVTNKACRKQRYVVVDRAEVNITVFLRRNLIVGNVKIGTCVFQRGV